MAEPSDEERRERLKSALWYHVGKIVDEESLKRRRNATPQFIGSLTELVITQVENIAQDLEGFSRHAGRTTVNTDDVLLLARRNADLHNIIKDYVDELKADKAKRSTKK